MQTNKKSIDLPTEEIVIIEKKEFKSMFTKRINNNGYTTNGKRSLIR